MCDTSRSRCTCLALGFGSGLAPVAPGTFGSLVGLAIALALAPLGLAWNLLAVVVAIVAGIWICGESARRLGVHDHPAIVWDEVAGMMIAMLAAPDAWWGAPAGVRAVPRSSTSPSPGRSARSITEWAAGRALCSTTYWPACSPRWA